MGLATLSTAAEFAAANRSASPRRSDRAHARASAVDQVDQGLRSFHPGRLARDSLETALAAIARVAANRRAPFGPGGLHPNRQRVLNRRPGDVRPAWTDQAKPPPFPPALPGRAARPPPAHP